ncbi:MAG TPA: NepR family anti-sigma factor [Verrucomicrobiae bacterium]|nr:NepR family anti-sigma factor [Verrucomicrobiae bacterium]
MTRKEDEMDAQVNNGPKAPGTPDQGKSPSKSSAATKALITRNLRLAYGEVAAEPTPQRLLDLLNSLDSEEKKS